ncbi:MAG: deoxyribose-phosphate aldolase [Bacteroidia bacterium]|nr:deoxyribose-phosphate aldolase [Bacteroidia bacterium]
MELAKHIEHTNLKPDCTKEEIIKLCNEAITNGFYGVCVSPYFVQLAKKTIGKKTQKIVTVVGFPLGYSTVGAKVEEAKKAIISGADEIDMVMNIAAFKSDDMQTVQNDIQSVVTVCHLQNKKVKVIIETAYLSDDEIIRACKVCNDCEVDFVKTSTGFASEGAVPRIVKLMRANLPTKIKIKAAGGIKTSKQALDLLLAGANVLGCSSSVKIIEENNENS